MTIREALILMTPRRIETLLITDATWRTSLPTLREFEQVLDPGPGWAIRAGLGWRRRDARAMTGSPGPRRRSRRAP